ncbi:MAG TPA: hypothetical protein VNK67_12410 [Burkholderiales bacterium]|nr:hypothetical protein [Burkholderiales bacterium]
MRPLAEIEAGLDTLASRLQARDAARALLEAAEEVLEHWVSARGETPTAERREGFRLLALHHQGTRGAPSFNACRETCREIAYHYNLIMLEPQAQSSSRHLHMMVMLVRHLALFVGGKLQVERLGEFCCSSRPLRLESPSTRVRE